APLVYSELDRIAVDHMHKLYVGALRKRRMSGNRSCFILPFGQKVFDEHNKVWIASGEHKAFQFLSPHIEFPLALNRSRAHLHVEAKCSPFMAEKPTHFRPGSRQDSELFLFFPIGEIGRDTASAVS